jgi:hypothetical protein
VISCWKGLKLQLFVGMFLVAPIAFPQGTSASLDGSIADSSGAIISHARITALNTDTNLVQVVYSNESGGYSIAPLPPGPYRITAEDAGFTKYVEIVVLSVDQHARLNFQLHPGSQSESVTVSAGTLLINATSPELSTVVDEQTIKELPLNGRDPSSLMFLAPGVVNVLNTSAGTLQSTDSFGTEAGGSAGGGQQGSTYALLDGVQNMDTYSALVAPFPNSDATQEFRVITNNFGAQYGFSSGAVISVDTKAGGNAFHGGLFEFVRNGDLNASNWFSGQVDTLKRNQFGGDIGGPIKKNSLFFFANYQATRQVSAALTNNANTPTAAMLNGDFSAYPGTLAAPFATVNGKPNQINPALYSPAAVLIATTALPLGQVPASGQVTFSSPAVLSTFNEGTGRIDYNISSTQRLFIRNFIQDFTYPAENINGNILATQIANLGQYYNEAISHTWLPTPSLVNVLTAAWIRMNVSSGNQVLDNQGSPFCMSKYVNITEPAGCYTEGFGVSGGFSGPYAEPNGNDRVTWSLSDHVIKTIGKHVVTAGFDLFHQLANTTTSYPAYPELYFDGHVTNFGLADFLIGQLSYTYQGAYQNSPTQGWRLAGYGQDQYKLSSKLTLTAGLRWEPDFAPNSPNGGSAFIPGEQSQRYANAPTGLVFPGDKGVTSALRPTSLAYFEPRVGFAWQPLSSSTVFRGGFGLFVLPLSADYYNNAVGVAPFSPLYYLTATTAAPIPFENPWATLTSTGGKTPFTTFEQQPNISPSQAFFTTPIDLQAVFAQNFKLPITQSWNLSVEQQLGRDYAVHLAYVGSETFHQSAKVDQNPGFYQFGGNRILYPDFSNIGMDSSIGTASYNALQVGFEKQVSNGLRFQSNFTWSKVLDLSSAGTFADQLADPFDIGFAHGISSLNVPLSSVSNFVYRTPGLAGHNAILRNALGGWEISGIVTFQSGNPFSISGGNGDNNSEAQQDGDRGDYVPGQSVETHKGDKSNWLAHYFNPLAFTTNPPGTFGDTGKNFLQGPGINTADAAIAKNWRIEAGYQLQFRWEMYNALNHPSFGLPSADPSSGNFGQITSIGNIAPRVQQGALKLTF